MSNTADWTVGAGVPLVDRRTGERDDHVEIHINRGLKSGRVDFVRLEVDAAVDFATRVLMAAKTVRDREASRR